ncbi:type II secretion system protein [uncultured Jatrophihabitans sp.]|uniref:type II secretion system protein n=1 Tax=uncultured Jatrophihabitans sp. TaxID=1610747 RepID=UPI0035CBCA74
MTALALRVRLRLRARLARVAGSADRGTTLVELLVGMAIMTVFMAIFLTSILLMSSTANKVEATTISATQTNQAFLKLDKMVRYASAVSTPGVSTASGDWYVEFDSPPTGVSTAQTGDTCTQLRLDSRQLQQRTWTVTNGVAAAASAWTPMASYVTNGSAAAGSADAPFTTPVAGVSASTSFQRLQLTLVATAGNSVTATNRSQMTFTALNSDVSLASNATTCQQWGRP